MRRPGIGVNHPVSNIVDALRWCVAQKPDATAFTFLIDGESKTETLSYAELDAQARNIAAMIRLRVPLATRVLILQEPGIDFVVSLYACFYAGVAAIPAPPPAARIHSRSARRFARLVQDAVPDVILTHPDLVAKMQWFAHSQAGLSNLAWVSTDRQSDPDSKMSELPPIQMTDLALIQYTSGSTGDPKGVAVSHGNLAADLAAIARKFGLSESSVVVNWLPPFHDMGLIGGIIEAVWAGYHVVLMDPRHFLQRPLRWLHAIDRFGGNVSGGANFAYELCVNAVKSLPVADLDLSKWRLAYSGAEPVRPATLRRFTETFAINGFQRSAFYPCYGLAEATLMAAGPDSEAERPRLLQVSAEALMHGRVAPVTIRHEQTAQTSIRELVSSGSACQDTKIIIVDPASEQVVADGQVGEIWLSGSIVTHGYWEMSSRSVVSNMRLLAGDQQARFLATGDMGFLLNDELYVTGRIKDLIIIRGKNHTPSDIEEVVGTSHPALLPDGSAAFSTDIEEDERLIIACEVRREACRSANHTGIMSEIRRQVSENSGILCHDIVLLKPGTLPRTTSGKLQRHACRQAYVDQSWDVLARQQTSGPLPVEFAKQENLGFVNASPADRMRNVTSYLCHRVVGLTTLPAAFVTPDSRLHATGLDSLKRIEFGLLIEHELEIILTAGLLERDVTIRELAALIRAEEKRSDIVPSAYEVTENASSGSMVPLAPMQNSFLSAGVEKPEEFIETVLFRIPAELNVSALERTLKALDQYHDAFALRFHHEEGVWRQYYGTPDAGIAFSRIDARTTQRQAFAKLREQALMQMKSAINLTTGPLADAILLDRGSKGGVLMIGFHHLVIDAVSLSIWVTQFQYAYQRACQGFAPLPDRGRPRFGPWLRDLHQYACSETVSRQVAYWQKVCGSVNLQQRECITLEDAPVDRHRQWRMTGKSTLSPVPNMRLMAKFQTGLERNCLFLAALGWAWRRETGEESLLVKLENHGRLPLSRNDPVSTVGWFTSQYPVRIELKENCTPDAFFCAVQEVFQAVPDLGVGYGLLSEGAAGADNQADLMALQKPGISLQYRSNIDDAFRKDVPFPVIGIIHDTVIWQEAACRSRDQVKLHLGVEVGKYGLQWYFSAGPSIDEGITERLLQSIQDFLMALIEDGNS